MRNKSALETLESYLQEMNSTAIGRRAFLAMAPALLAACATAQHRQREGDNSGQQTELSIADEKRMTQEAMMEMAKDYPPVQDANLQLYVKGLGKRLVQANGLEGNPYNYNFTAVAVPQVNAFALPAGTIFVTTPLIAMAETEAELAGVIGHEIGHVKARHTAERIDRAKKAEGKSWLYGAGGGILGGIAGFGLGKLFCGGSDKCMAAATAAGAAAGVGGGLLIQKYQFMANSREDEMEADRIGFRTAIKAGYDKNHVGTFYAKLLQMEQQAKKNSIPILAGFGDAMSTHPPSTERVAQMQDLAAQSAGGKSLTSTKEFERVKKIAAQWAKDHPYPKSS
jgi:predicted Zn-dependent protease